MEMSDLESPSKYARTKAQGEAVVRELLNANFLEEQSLTPQDQPVALPTDETQA